MQVIFDTDDESTHFLVTLPAHDIILVHPAKREMHQDKELTFKSLQELIYWSNQDSNQDSTQEIAHPDIEQLLRNNLGTHTVEILEMLSDAPLSKNEILAALGLTNQWRNKDRHIDPLLSTGWISFTLPEKPNDRSQKYKITPSGKRLLQLITQK